MSTLRFSTVVSLVLANSCLWGQEAISPERPAAAPPAAATAPMAPAAAADTRMPVRERERTVYVPYEELERVFKDGGKGVFLPYHEFLNLWNELSLQRAEDDTPPPADAVLTRAEYIGVVANDSVILEAKLSAESGSAH